MQDLTKAQITIGMLAFFATVWTIYKYSINNPDLLLVSQAIILQFVVMIVLSFVLLAILEWLRLFDLKTNSILTLITLVTIPMLAISI